MKGKTLSLLFCLFCVPVLLSSWNIYPTMAAALPKHNLLAVTEKASLEFCLFGKSFCLPHQQLAQCWLLGNRPESGLSILIMPFKISLPEIRYYFLR